VEKVLLDVKVTEPAILIVDKFLSEAIPIELDLV
jgi:hypothetical protein